MNEIFDVLSIISRSYRIRYRYRYRYPTVLCSGHHVCRRCCRFVPFSLVRVSGNPLDGSSLGAVPPPPPCLRTVSAARSYDVPSRLARYARGYWQSPRFFEQAWYGCCYCYCYSYELLLRFLLVLLFFYCYCLCFLYCCFCYYYCYYFLLLMLLQKLFYSVCFFVFVSLGSARLSAR